MPVGLQIIGRRFEDEKIVAILKYFESNKCLPELPQRHEPEKIKPENSSPLPVAS